MNLVATGPVTPPLASEPWHGTQNVVYCCLPMASDESVALIGLGCLAATSRCSLGMIGRVPRGTTPVGIAKTRSAGALLVSVIGYRWLNNMTQPAKLVADDADQQRAGRGDD